MKSILILPLLLLCTACYAQAPVWEWAQSSICEQNVEGRDISVDNLGNIYVTGFFSDNLVLGTTSLTSAGGKDIFVAKYDYAGQLVWAKSAGGALDDVGTGVACDAQGNVCLAGYFKGTANFNSQSLSSAGEEDIYLAKYNSTGDLMWAVSAGGAYPDRVSIEHGGIAIDKNGNIIIAGSYAEDPASPPAHQSATFDTITLTSKGGSDIFLAKYNSSGNILWAKTAGGVFSDAAMDVTVDQAGNVFVTGAFYDPWAEFGSIKLMSKGSYSDLFLAKYDANGNVIWAQSAGGSFPDVGTSVATDQDGNAYVVGGGYNSNMDFGNGIILNTLGDADICLAKYDANGNVQWAKNAGWKSFDVAHGVAVDGESNVYLTGSFNQFGIFGNDTLTASNNPDIYVAKYNTNGAAMWAQKAGGTGTDEGNSVAVDASGHVFATGVFNNAASFGKHQLPDNDGLSQFFIAKLGLFPEDVSDIAQDNFVKIFPNPSQDVWNIAVEKSYPPKISAALYNVLGGKVWEQSDIDREWQIRNEHLPAGVYQLHMSINGESRTYKLIK